MDRPEDLRAALASELAAPELNSDRFAELAAALVNSDPRRDRFTVDAGVLARLGRELVVRHETALSELVKNPYDADAQRVVVRIMGPSHGDYIEVADDGSGMTHVALLQGFMRLATNDKVEHPLSPKFKRRRAGRKGIGRFAAERLGKKLILTTATQGEELALRMEIEWERFVPGRELAAISIPVKSVPKSRPQGTILRMERLRDTWPSTTIQRTFEHVAGLIDLGDQTKSGFAKGSDFTVSFVGDRQDQEVIDIRSQVASHSYAKIELEVDERGQVTWDSCPALSIDFKKRALRVGENETNQLNIARRVRMLSRYYILQSRYFPPTVLRTVQNYLAANGGVRVYRNSFRVPPYGQQGDDWLGLDLLSSRRTRTLAPVRNRNFLGSVSLDDDAAGLFEETASREGLIGSPAFDELVASISAAILAGVREIDAERGRQDLKRERLLKSPDETTDRAPSSVVAQGSKSFVRSTVGDRARDQRVSCDQCCASTRNRFRAGGCTARDRREMRF